MRPSRWISLICLCLLTRATVAYAQAQENGGDRAKRTIIVRNGRNIVKTFHPIEDAKHPTWSATGYGETEKDAELDALKNVGAEITEYLWGTGISHDWSPSLNDLRGLVTGEPKTIVKDMEGIGPVRETKLQLEMTPKAYRRLLQQDRQHRAMERISILGKIMIVVVALLVALAGYFKLEDATKGYYTAWLRLAAISFIAAIAAGLWFFSTTAHVRY